MNRKLYYLLFIILLACHGEDGETGETGLTTLAAFTDEQNGNNCQDGGTKIDLGLDLNHNNALDPNEIKTTNYICNGQDGYLSLTSIQEKSPDENCDNGGYIISSGLDINMNQVLDDEEIASSAIVCHGIDDGKTSITRFSNEPMGPNCNNGGIKIRTGPDLNNNGILENEEISSVSYSCNNANAGDLSLINVYDLPVNNTCEKGGILLESGRDINGNTLLDDDEVNMIKMVCHSSFHEEIRLILRAMGSGASGTKQEAGNIFGRIANFDKSNWTKAHSITYNAYIYTEDYDNTCYVELYNITDNEVIQGTTLSTNATTYPGVLVSSGNIIDNLPDKEITLGLRVRTENEGTYVWIGRNAEIIIN